MGAVHRQKERESDIENNKQTQYKIGFRIDSFYVNKDIKIIN